MTKISLEEKINTIKSERKQLIESTIDTLSNNKNILVEEVKQITSILDKDEFACKKSIELMKVHELIDDLTDQIINANTKEDIINIRKKLNYYINKIKNVMKKRGMSEEEINNYSEKVTDVRKNISKYLRFVKRNSNLEEIDNLLLKEELSEEELTRYKKLIRLEGNYNKRIMNPKPKKVENVIPTPEIVVVPEDDEEQRTTIITIDDEEPVKRTNRNEGYVQDDITSNNLRFIPNDEVEYIIESDGLMIIDVVKSNNECKTIEDYLRQQVELFCRRYGIQDNYPYKDKLFKNLKIFFKNLPIYKRNKNMLPRMFRDYNIFYGGADLRGFIEYIKDHNSVKYGLKQLFSKTKICENEEKYLQEHQECIEWIIDYCNSNKLFLKAWSH